MIPAHLVSREYTWEMVNSELYQSLREAPYSVQYLPLLLETQREQIKLILEIMSQVHELNTVCEYDLVTEGLPAGQAINELIEREDELRWVYQSYRYFLIEFTGTISKADWLVQTQLRQLELLRSWKNQLSPERGESDNHGRYWLKEGFRLELVADGLTFPTSLDFDEAGEIYVTEAGFSYGPAAAPPRLVHVTKGGELRTVAQIPERIITGLAVYDNSFYLVTGDLYGKVLRVSRNGKIETLVEGLRGGGDHYTSDIVFGPDHKMYFGVGTVTNSSVVGRDNLMMGWLGRYEWYHDLPARDLVLAGRNYTTDNFLTKLDPDDQAVTGSFHPFGVPALPGEVIPGQLLANGVVYRANSDGTGLEVYADGFRNVFGLGFDSHGTLYATNQGLDFRGSRPVSNDWDSFYEVRPGWYGWPDFGSGLPLTLGYFTPPNRDSLQFVLAEHPPLAAQPVILFKPHTATTKFAFCSASVFGRPSEAYFAQFGDQTPMTGLSPTVRGYRVVKADLFTGRVQDFLVNLRPGLEDRLAGPERPIAIRFSPDGRALYILDFGVMQVAEGVIYPYAETGALWRVIPV